jgi:hypothetical protein
LILGLGLYQLNETFLLPLAFRLAMDKPAQVPTALYVGATLP